MPLRVLGVGAAVLAAVVSLCAPVDPARAELAASAGSIEVALVVPLVVPKSTTPFISADALTQYTGPGGLLTRQLDAVADRPVTVAIDPLIIASIRVLGTSSPATAIAWLSRLDSIRNDTFALQYADADMTLGTQAGSPTVLAPAGFGFGIDPTRFGPPDTGTTGQSPQAVPASPALPTSDQLAAWDYTIDRFAWPKEDSVVAADLAAIAAGDYATTMLSSANLVSPPATGPIASIGSETVVVADVESSVALRAAAAAPNDQESQQAVARLGEAVRSAARPTASAPNGTVVATASRGIPISATRLAETIDALAADPTVSLVGLGSVITRPAASATLIDEPQPAARVAMAQRMLAAERSEQEFATIATDPALVTAPRRLELLAILSAGWSDDSPSWPTVAEAFLTRSLAIRDSVHLVESSNVNLFADNGQRLPITVANELDQPVTIYVAVRPGSGLLAVDTPQVKQVVNANSQAKVDVPVTSLSNGVVDVMVTLAGVSGVVVGPAISTEVNVQAGWETPIVVGFGAIVLGLFAIGILRTVLRRRRLSREAGTQT